MLNVIAAVLLFAGSWWILLRCWRRARYEGGENRIRVLSSFGDTYDQVFLALVLFGAGVALLLLLVIPLEWLQWFRGVRPGDP